MNIKILIVDDSKLARMSVAKMLHNLRPDWSRVEATDADSAMAMIAAERPDIVLFDFNMPGRNGLELASDIHARDPDMPIALISANIQNEIVAGAQAVGAAFLAKPLSEPALAGFLAEASRLLAARVDGHR